MPKDLVPDDYYRAARQLLPAMDETIQKKVEDLLKRSEAGEKTDNSLVDVITEDKILRKKFREILESNSDSEGTMGMNFSQLAGNANSPDARKYICPVPGHNLIRRIQKAGEDPGICPTHNLPLIPIHQKGNN